MQGAHIPHRAILRRSLLKAFGVAATASAIPPIFGAAASALTPLHVDAEQKQTVPNSYLNQIGYLPGQRKIATILAPDTPAAEAASNFHVRDAQTHAIAFTGRLPAFTLDAASGKNVSKADFSSLKKPGLYCVYFQGKLGDRFRIGQAVYADALYSTMRAFYGQRCGCKVDLGGGYSHPSCHHEGEFGLTSGKTGKVENAGGWHDAGDYGRYVVNSGITCGTLLWAWELFPDAVRSLSLNIPESGQALPDFLAEVKWNLQWMLSMQDPADGGVWHKQTSLHFCTFIMPEKDILPSEIIGTGAEPYKSTCASGDLAAVMAIAARCYRPFDPTFADRCLAAARHAFSWCNAHPDVVFKNPPSVATGEYGDAHCADEVLWAAAELFRTTHEAEFEKTLLQAVMPLLPSLRIEVPSWGNVASMALWSYAFATSGKPSSVTDAIRSATQGAAKQLIEQEARNGFGNTLSEADYHWGSNSDAGNQALLLIVANHFQPDPAAINAAFSNLHYLLGRNCFGVSWVTQLGARPFLHPHHRPSAADGIVAPWPGLLSGGPNARGGDAVADKLSRAAPMQMWVDDELAYSLNEVAINWNAPLVFLLAAANSKSIQL